MKTNNYLFLFSILLSVIILSEGCKKDEDPPKLIIEEMNLSGDMMTLSAIAYVSESKPESIKDSIEYYLNDASLTTKGNWKLVWGPGIPDNDSTSNLVYVVKNSALSPEAYAIVIRGTNTKSIFDIVEDINVFKMTQFTFGKSEDSVAQGAMDGFNNLISAKDKATGTILEEFLNSVSTSQKVPLYVTGHSQGGGLAPMIAYWLVSKDEYQDKFETASYAFAGPGWFNKSFTENFKSALASDEHFIMMVNSLDMIPHGYADLPGINSKNIPVHVPLLYRTVIALTDSTLKSLKLKYYNVTVADTIGHIPITATVPGGITPADTIQWYDHWLMVEHSHNSYLELLNAVPIN